MMAFPKLVRNPKTSVRVVIVSEEPNEFGERPVILDKSFRCNYQDSGSLKYTSEKQHTEVTGVLYIDGDILESLGIETLDFSVNRNGTLILSSGELDENGALSYTRQEETESDLVAAGYVIVFGRRREIVKGTKARNLDGSVNYTRLDVR